MTPARLLPSTTIVLASFWPSSRHRGRTRWENAWVTSTVKPSRRWDVAACPAASRRSPALTNHTESVSIGAVRANCWFSGQKRGFRPMDSIFDLSPSEKLQLVEDLWDDLAATP